MMKGMEVYKYAGTRCGTGPYATAINWNSHKAVDVSSFPPASAQLPHTRASVVATKTLMDENCAQATRYHGKTAPAACVSMSLSARLSTRAASIPWVDPGS